MIFVFSACSSVATPTPTALSPTEPIVIETEGTSSYYPLDIVTNIEEIDVVLRAVASGDPQQLRDLFGYTTATCKTVQGLGGPPPCHEGEAEGTSVEVLSFLGSEGSFLRRDEAVNYPGIQAVGIYAIYETSENVYSEENYPAGEYGIMLLSEGSEPGIVLQVKDGKIVRIDSLFDPASYRDIL